MAKNECNAFYDSKRKKLVIEMDFDAKIKPDTYPLSKSEKTRIVCKSGRPVIKDTPKLDGFELGFIATAYVKKPKGDKEKPAKKTATKETE